MNEQPLVVMCSLWRNDAGRNLVQRAEHLLSKQDKWHNLRWCWIVGDSDDDTAAVLSNVALGYDVNLVTLETRIAGDDMPNRLRRLSASANAFLQRIRDDDDYVLVHESDISSGPDVVARMVANAEDGRCPVAAWPVLRMMGIPQFYDTWAYRKGGQHLSHDLRKHPIVPFEVDSFGTVYLFAAEDGRSVRMKDQAVLDLCTGLRARGRTLWADPRILVEQPYDLWVPYQWSN